MKRLSLLVGLIIVIAAAPDYEVQAQRKVNGFNPNSVLPIHTNDIMYEKRVWRRMDLEEKQNLPFFAFNNEITKIIIDAVKAGLIPVYKNDSLLSRYTKEEFLENLKIPDYGGGGLTKEEKEMGFSDEGDGWGGGDDDGGDDSWGDDGWGGDDGSGGEGDGGAGDGEEGGGKGADSGADVEYFFPTAVSVIEIMEDMIFDRKRSRLFWDIQSLKLILPAKNFETGLQRDVGVFKYIDLERLFRSMPEVAIWFNPQNQAEHRNLAEAFALRLFNARIVKVANPKNDYLVDIYNQFPKAGIIASQKAEQDLMELEHNLWEF
jgi:gliding motility-associated GldN-like protein